MKLPRYSRLIAVVHEPAQRAPVTHSSGSSSVLTPFAGLLNALAEPSQDTYPFLTFSYLTLQPLIDERILDRESVIIRDDRMMREDKDRAETTRELRVHHLFRGDSVAPDPEADQSTNEESRQMFHPGPENRSEPTRDISVVEPFRSRGTESSDQTDRLRGPIQNITILGAESLTVLKGAHTGVPQTGDRTQDQTSDRERASARSERLTAKVPPGRGERPRLSSTPTMMSMTNTTLRRPMQARPVSGSPTGEFRVRDAGKSPTLEPTGDEAPDGRSDATLGPIRTTLANRDGLPRKPSQKLTVVDSTPLRDETPAQNGPNREHSEPETTGMPFPRPGEPFSSDRSERTADRSANHPTVKSITNDRTEMNRLVDRLYDEVQRKLRIERERRGL